VTEDSKKLKTSHDVNNSQNANRDQVLKRMLKMPPQPQKKSTPEVSQQLKFANSKLSDGNISQRNKKS